MDTVIDGRFFKIFFNNCNECLDLIAVIGRQVYKINLEETGEEIQFSYILDMGAFIDNDSNFSIFTINNLVINKSKTNGVMSKMIAHVKPGNNPEEEKEYDYAIEMRFFQI